MDRSSLAVNRYVSNRRHPLLSEEPVIAVVTARFDLGFYVELADGRTGQLRVPEMLPGTAEWDRSADKGAGIGRMVEVYLDLEADGRHYFSEYSSDERAERERKHKSWLQAQEQATVGKELTVLIEHKPDWGCICREQSEPFLEGVIPTSSTVATNRLPPDCAVTVADWKGLTVGKSVAVSIAAKKQVGWGHILYFSLLARST